MVIIRPIFCNIPAVSYETCDISLLATYSCFCEEFNKNNGNDEVYKENISKMCLSYNFSIQDMGGVYETFQAFKSWMNN